MHLTLLRPADYMAAILPVATSLTLSEWNSLVALIGGLLGIAYLIWRWASEVKAKRKERGE